MRFGISWNTAVYGLDPDQLTGVARQAAVADPLECLSFVAAATERLLLGTGVLLLLPYHDPVVLAKRLATIDLLSRGRLRLLTIGVGALPGEAAGVGVDFATRGRRTDEAIEVLTSLWAGDAEGVSHRGEFFAFDRICSFPKPYQGSSLPIHVGGSSAAAARRAGSVGAGYFAGGRLSPSELARQWQQVRATAATTGRDPETLEYTRWGSIDLSRDDVRAMADEGVTRLVVSPGLGSLDEQREELSAFAHRHGLG